MAIAHSLYCEAGTVSVNRETCTQCGQCARVCPADVLTQVNGSVQVSRESPFGCIACGHCMMVCPGHSITVTGRGLSGDDLRPMPASDQKADADALEALMHTRRSIRHFTDREIDPALLERIVDMAASAPMGIPPWDVGCITVCGREKVQTLADELIKQYQGFLKVCKPWLLRIMRPLMKRVTYEQFSSFIIPLARLYVDAHRQGRDALFYHAPALMLFHHSPYTEIVDATIACTYAMLAAESLRLGTTIIGGAPPILKRNKTLCRDLGIPDGNTPALALILGYPAVRFQRTIRRQFSHTHTVSL